MSTQNWSIEPSEMAPQGGTDVDALYQLSLVHFQDGRWQDAIAGFGEVLRLSPGHEEARAFLEEAMLKASLDKDKPRPRRFRWGWLKRLVQILAIVCLLLALGTGIWYAYGRWIQPAQRASQDKTRTAQLVERAYNFLAERDYAQAEEAFRALLSEDPDSQAAQDGLAAVARQFALAEEYAKAQQAISQEQWDEALRILDTIAEQEPDYKDTQAKQELVEEQQQLGEAFANAEKAFEEDDWQVAITIYEALRSVDAAYQKQDVKEHLFQSYLNQGIHLVQSTKGDSYAVVEAQGLYQKALTMQPLNGHALKEMALAKKFTEGQSRLAKGDEEGAIAAFAWVQQLQPDYAAGTVATLLEAAGVEEDQGETAASPPSTPAAPETASSDLPVPPPSEELSFREQYDLLMGQGDDAMTAGDYGQAEDIYLQAATVGIHGGTDSASWLFDAYAKAGGASARDGDYEQAFEEAKTAVLIMSKSAVAIPPESYESYVEQGDEYAKNEDYLAALQNYDMALRTLGQKRDSTSGSSLEACPPEGLLPCEE